MKAKVTLSSGKVLELDSIKEVVFVTEDETEGVVVKHNCKTEGGIDIPGFQLETRSINIELIENRSKNTEEET